MKQILLILLLTSLVTCKKPVSAIDAIIDNKTLTDQEACVQIAREIFGDMIKEIHTGAHRSGNKHGHDHGVSLHIEFGPKSAFTFLNKDEYLKAVKIMVGKYLFRLFATAPYRGLMTAKLSLVKPVFIKNAEYKEDKPEDFELFRVRFDVDWMHTVWIHGDVDPFLEDKHGVPVPEVMEKIDKIAEVWKVELNELHRLEMK